MVGSFGAHRIADLVDVESLLEGLVGGPGESFVYSMRTLGENLQSWRQAPEDLYGAHPFDFCRRVVRSRHWIVCSRVPSWYRLMVEYI